MSLNNIDEAKLFKKEKNDWIKLYHKTLQGIETIIDVQRQVKKIMKMSRRNKYYNHGDGEKYFEG